MYVTHPFVTLTPDWIRTRIAPNTNTFYVVTCFTVLVVRNKRVPDLPEILDFLDYVQKFLDGEYKYFKTSKT